MTPATCREVRKYVRADVQSDVIVRAARLLGMKVAESHHEELTLRVRLSFWSFGEKVTVGLGSVDGCSVVDVTSSCVLRTQIADWGKNERNVRKLFTKIDKLLGDNCEYVRCLLCKECGYLLVGISGTVCPECGHAYSPNEKPGRQEMATLRNTLALAVALAAVESVLILAIGALGAGRFVPWPVLGLRSAISLLWINIASLLGVVGLHRLVKRYLRQR